LCYVAFDFDKEMKKDLTELEQYYELPDGNKIVYANERFRVPELLFDPSMIGSKNSVQSSISLTISKTESNLIEIFSGNILLSGGTCLLPGIAKRTEKELNSILNLQKPLNIEVSKTLFSSWIGGSIFSTLSNFKDILITKERYEEFGPSIVHQCCI
jgi:actin, other eukaryote